MGYLLKEGLKTLCGVNQWSYAVFWKFGTQNPKILIWEECYYEPESCLPDKVHLVLNKMMMDSHVNIVGEGLVGRVAFTGDHQWIQSESYCIDSHPPEVVKEVYQQFSAGMQTIVVIPVFPHGIVQFGSSKTIMESLGFINDVTSLILQIGHASGALLNYEGNEHATGNGVSIGDFTPVASSLDSNVANTQCSFDPFNYVYNTSQQIQDELQSNEMFHIVEPSNSNSIHCFTSNYLLTYSSDSKLHHMGKLEQIESHECNEEMGWKWNTTQAHDIPHMAELLPSSVQDEESGDDLFDVLGADFKKKLFSSNCWNSCLSNESQNKRRWDGNKTDLPPNRSLASSYTSTSQANSESGIFSVVSKTQPSSKHTTDENPSCITTLTNTTITPLPYGRSGSKISSWMEKDQQAKPSNSLSTAHSMKPDQTGKANKKRFKPGEKPRPRPKDRQLIQDRVKELREIVPNGAKCSIDALLERTIKHMLFLQSVTKHVDKLKQTGQPKNISKDGGLPLKDSSERGATWAYEIGSQSMICPIIVEDLNQPRQMLVEMLCEERGWFLEIVDIIRGLGLTILKGAMEARHDKIWARFAVEANRDVTRMEIFISLVRILEQSLKV